MCEIVFFDNSFFFFLIDLIRHTILYCKTRNWISTMDSTLGFPLFLDHKRKTVFPKACLSVSGLASIEPCVFAGLLRDSD